MRPSFCFALILLLWLTAVSEITPAQEDQTSGHRVMLSRTAPSYPEMARKMGLEGVVKLRVTIAPRGSTKLEETLGGSPLLAKAAEDAVYKWRWAPLKDESVELVELRFRPE
jgi:TonB family protein